MLGTDTVVPLRPPREHLRIVPVLSAERECQRMPRPIWICNYMPSRNVAPAKIGALGICFTPAAGTDLYHCPPNSSSRDTLTATAAAADEAALAAALADSTFAVTESTKVLHRQLCLRLDISDSDRYSCSDLEVSPNALLACSNALS